MKRPIDPNLQDFSGDIQNTIEDTQQSTDNIVISRETNQPIEQNQQGLHVEVKANHYSGEGEHHHHHHSSSSSSHSSGEHHHSSGEHHHSSGEHHHSSSSHSSHSKKKKISTAGKIAIVILCILLALVIAVVSAFFIVKEQGKSDLTNISAETDYQEIINYQGHKYVYNSNMVTMAFLGVDKRELGLEDGVVGTAGQSDACIVVAIDSSTGKVTAIAVPRDTMVEIDLYSESGVFLRTETMQLCLSYAYGDGKETSAENVTTSISRILKNVPISKYFALDLDGIAPLNDAIGGVTVQSLYDFEEEGIKVGDTILLEGDLTETYVRHRSMDTIDASLNRTARQVQYIKAYAGQLVPAVMDDFSVISKLYDTASEYCSTDITLSNATYLASLLISKNVTDFDTITLEGEMKASDNIDYADYVYAEFYPDEDALMQTVLDVFYKQVD